MASQLDQLDVHLDVHT